jgi:hypothetical protein
MVLMSTCSRCSARLEPDWKFCIACGERVVASAIPGATATPAAPAIPGAIRPDAATPAPAPDPNPLVAVAVVVIVISLLIIGAVLLLVNANAG